MVKSGYTLISILGKGQFEQSDKGKYRVTKYKFENGFEYESSLFVESVFQRYKCELEKVIIVGTKTSFWPALIADYSSDSDYINELFLNVEASVKETGITDEQLQSLESVLSKIHGISFKLLSHNEALTKENISAISEVYSSAVSHIKKKTKLLLDITYGFRYMPMLMYQNMQFLSAEYELDEINILYGEYIDTSRQISTVRDISSLWQLSEINKQVFAFESGFDGFKLGKTLDLFGYKSLGKWVCNFSEMVQKNYVMQISVAISSLRKVLEQNKNTSGKPLFYERIVKNLNALCLKFNNVDKLSDMLFAFSEILNDKGLVTQSIIALRESVAIALFEKYDPNKIGKYVELNDWNGPGYYLAYIDGCKNNGIYYGGIKDLFKARNEIAHAGAGYFDKDFTDIKWDYEQLKQAVLKSRKVM